MFIPKHVKHVINRDCPYLFYLFILFALALSACGPSYPKDNLSESLPKLLKKEYGMDSTVDFVGKTLYLNVVLPGLTSTETDTLKEVLKNVQGAMLTITRVSLSSDAEIEFMIVNATDVSKKINLRLIQRLEDVKGLLYHRISRGDYEGRLVLEIEASKSTADEDDYTDSYEKQAKKEIAMEEFVGRLLVSNYNMLSRSNPFLSVLLNNSQLSYRSFAGRELVIELGNELSDAAKAVFEQILAEQAEKVFEKYKAWQPETIKAVGTSGQEFFISLGDKKGDSPLF